MFRRALYATFVRYLKNTDMKQRPNNHTHGLRSGFVILLLLLLATNGALAQGWRHWSLNSRRNDFLKIDPNYVNGRLNFLTLKVDHEQLTEFQMAYINGEESGVGAIPMPQPADQATGFMYNPIDMFRLHDDTVYILTNRFNEALGHESIYLLKYVDPMLPSPAGPWALASSMALYDVVGERARCVAMRQLPDGHLAVLGETTAANGGSDLMLAKLDLAGNILWSQVYATGATSEEAVQLELAEDGGFYVLYTESGAAQPSVKKVLTLDVQGEVVFDFELPVTSVADIPTDMIRTADGDLAISGNIATTAMFVTKVGTDGQFRWRQEYLSDTYAASANTLAQDAAQHLVVAGSVVHVGYPGSHGFLAKLSNEGTPIWERTIWRQSTNMNFTNDWFNDIAVLPSGGYLMVGGRLVESPAGYAFGYAVKTDSMGIILGGNISGNVFRDLDADCALSAGDASAAGWVVKAVDGDRQYFGTTDADGHYSFPVAATLADPGNYTVSILPLSPYWEPCQNEIPVLVEYLSSVEVDFGIQAQMDCPYLSSSFSIDRFRICDTTQISFNYCNIGSEDAQGAYVEIEIDPALTFLSASVAPTAVVGNVYTFDLEDVPVFACGEILISAIVSCDSAQLGSTLCLYANILPDTLCGSGGNWDGALINGSYDCNEDEVQFRLQNVGNADMGTALPYVIIEDAVLLMEGTFDLAASEDIFTDPLPQNGSVYTLVAQQAQGAPGAQVITMSVAGCDETPPSALGYYNGNPYSTLLCGAVVGSYDPNDKLAYPTGEGDDHLILPNTELLYTIRFQNTGTDTAFRVVIRDTLSDRLNLSTLQPLASSHPYRWGFEDQTLVFSFYDIALPDSTTNPEASQGFIQFKVRQRPNLPAGTYIGSSASIYFDFNAPVQTNVAFHTVADFIELINEATTIAEPSWAVSVAPNPVADGAWIRLDGSPWPYEQLELQLFDATGRPVAQLPGKGEGFWFERGGLPAGLYVFSIRHPQGGWLASGKVMVTP